MFYTLLQNISKEKAIVGKVQKYRAPSRTEFSSPTALQRFYSYTNKITPICPLSVFHHFWNFESNFFISSEILRYFATGSDVIEIFQKVFMFKYLSVPQISRKSSEPFSRYPLHIIRKKRKTRRNLVAIRNDRSSVWFASMRAHCVYTYDHYSDMMRFRYTIVITPLLLLVTKYWLSKRCSWKILDSFFYPFCLKSKERSCDVKHFFMISLSHFRHFKMQWIAGADPITADPLNH